MKKNLLCIIKIILFTLVALAGSLIFEIITKLVLSVIEVMRNPGIAAELAEGATEFNLRNIKYMMFFGKIAMSMVAIGFYFGFYRNEEHGFKKSIKGNTVIFAIVAGIAIQLVISVLLGFIMQILPQKLSEDYGEVMDSLSTIDVFSILSVVVLAPISEEFLCRGVIQRCAEEAYSKIAAVFIQAVVFGLIHMQLIQSSYAFVIGIVFGYFSMKYRTVWIGVIIHISLNASSYLLPYIPDTVSFFGININMQFVFYGLTILLSAVTVILFRKLPKPETIKAEEVPQNTATL